MNRVRGMNRKEKIYREIKNLTESLTKLDIEEGFSGWDATFIGNRLGFNRNNTSKELNILFQEKKVIKMTGRPVHYLSKASIENLYDRKIEDNEKLIFNSMEELLHLIKEKEKKTNKPKDVFQRIIGSRGSLKIPIKQAKAAILYPPRGLHTLLIGDTGVGKTMFAEMMYNYAKESNSIKKDAPFIIFNCAEYADNPQLLLAQLFGYIKGAFTGADKDKPGIIEKANGGILLLDEIHRLSPEGQEMLFLLIDKNIYRRLGETENTHNADILLIAATTEDIQSSLLKTFLRRLPMIIKLPSLSQRSTSERFKLIQQFLKDEVKCVNAPIRVYKDVIKAFLLYDCQGNIGQLKGDLQLTCARGFLEYTTYNRDWLEIETHLIPEHVYRGLLNIKKIRDEIIELLELNNKEYFEFTKENQEDITVIDEYNLSKNLYQEFGEEFKLCEQKGYSKKKTDEKLNNLIEKYLQELLEKFNVEKVIPKREELFKIISPRVYYAVETALKIGEQKLKKEFSSKITIALAMHISALMERIATDRTMNSKELNNIAFNNPEEFNTAKLMKEFLEKELDILIPVEEIGFIAMFLYAVDVEDLGKSKHIGIIILAHGRSTASSIAEVSNSLLGINHCRAIDMPLEEKVDVVLEKATKFVKEVDQGKGVLMLVDMGSLIAFGDIISKKTGISVKTVEMVSTPIAIEALRKSFLPEMSLEELTKDIQRISPYVGREVVSKLTNYSSEVTPKVILTNCLTGKGSAVKISQYLKSSLPILNDYKISIKPVSIDNYHQEINLEKILAVVGAVDLNISNVPYIPIDEVIVGNGLKKLENIIGGTSDHINVNYKEPNVIINVLEDSLTFLNPKKAYNTVSQAYNGIQEKVEFNNSKRKEIAFIIHNCCMIERLIKKDSLSYTGIEKIIDNNKTLYLTIKNSLKSAEETFGIEVPDTEIGYILDLIDTH